MSMPIGRNPTRGNSSLTGGNYFGGPRGAAAGGLNALVNFAVNYDPGRLKQLAADIKGIQAAQALNAQRTEAYQQRIVALNAQIAEGELARLKLGPATQAIYKDLLALQQKATLEVTAYGRVTQKTTADLIAQERLVKSSLGLTTQQGTALRAMQDRKDQLVAEEAALNAATENGVALEGEKLALIREQGIAEQARNGLSRIGALGLGLIGGTIGGAIISSAIQPIQDAIKGLSDAFSELVDPSKAASAALSDVASEIEKVKGAASDTSSLQAASDILKGISPNSGSLAGTLSTAGDLKALQDKTAEQKKINDYVAGYSSLLAQANEAQKEQNARTEILAQTYLGRLNPAVQQYYEFVLNIRSIPIVGDLEKSFDSLTSKVLGTNLFDVLTAGFGSAANTADDAAKAADALAKTLDYIQGLQQENISGSVSSYFDNQINSAKSAFDAFKQHAEDAAATAIDAINRTASKITDSIRAGAEAEIKSLQRQMQNIQVTPSGRTDALQKQLDALKDVGPSKRTNELADAIERINKAQAERQYRDQLLAIDEERSQILLARRLATTKDAINIEAYQGKNRIIAIDALIARQQKINDAQDRFNKLLDIQYQISTGVRRQQGETIQDFIRRRAQYYRGLLQQAAELRRQGPLEDLKAERDRVQTSIDLKDLETKKRQLIEDHARAAYLQSLQDQLAASKARDQKELESRRATIQKELDASKKADQDRAQAQRQALQDRIDAVRASEQKQIDAVNNTRDVDIAAVQKRRDAAIAAAQQTLDKVVAGLQAQADQVQKWTQFSNVQALDTAINGAQSMAQLQGLSGAISGLQWTMNYLYQTGGLMGMDPAARASLMNSYIHAIQDYGSKVQHLYTAAHPPAAPSFGPSKGPAGSAGGGFKEGGMIPLTNASTPFGQNMHFGEEGPEAGMFVLNNKIMHAMREQGMGKGLIGRDMIINQSDDPYRDRAAWRREIRDVVRQEMH